MDAPSPADVRSRLLAWYDAGHRDMPWRRTKDPYRILLAEYLLQRTRVASGRPYYERFLERFPDVASLAAAREEDVLRAWEGLGFYRRARNLHAAAKAVVRDHGGRIPADAATLATLPGIGAYTAGAVASIAFGEAVPAVDGNVIRILSRVYQIGSDVTRPAGRRDIEEVAQTLVPMVRPGAFNQALMELGATVCLPRRPSCGACPLQDVCLAFGAGLQSSLPRKATKRPPTPVRVAFAYIRARDRTLLVRRPDGALLGGLWSLPGGEIEPGHKTADALRGLVEAQTGLRVRVLEDVARVAHTFSHRRWSGVVVRCQAGGRGHVSGAARWVDAQEAAHLPLVPAHRTILQEIQGRPSLDSFARTRRLKRA